MELKFTIDTDDIYEDEKGFEYLLTDSLRREVIKNCKNGLATDEFKKFATLASDTIIAGVKLKMENFLAEEIAITERWGEKTFVGSIEDLIKKRFDDVLLRSVDDRGETIKGCTTKGKTWVEWRIGDILDKQVDNIIKRAADNIERTVRSSVKDTITKLKDGAIKKQVDDAFVKILNQAA